MKRPLILVVDDDWEMLRICSDALGDIGGSVVRESDGRKAIGRLSSEVFDLVILDLCIPDVTGVELLEIVRARNPSTPTLIMTGYPTLDTAVACMRGGASDYIPKPFASDELRARAKGLLERRPFTERKLKEEGPLLRRSSGNEEILGRSPAIEQVRSCIARLSGTDIDVLITGETGTGKELVARAIHRESLRRKRRFVPVDCGAIPEGLMESEFFGHERGAFTGASEQRMGLVELADGGTLFLDEISSLAPGLQAKLLRVLQERRFRRVGGKEEISADFRVVAAANVDLSREVSAKRFRPDLYYRLNIGRVELPPLRRRPEDIPVLARHFLEGLARGKGMPTIEVSPECLAILCAYAWPGNVRELQNLLQRVEAMCDRAVLTAEDLPEDIVVQSGVSRAHAKEGFFALRAREMARFERWYMESLLASTRGEVSKAAEQAGIPRGTLYRLLIKQGLSPNDFRSRRPDSQARCVEEQCDS